ncbi:MULTISPECIES: ferrochelatase [Halomonas]|uniref:ferrochelatase n=1 Tax=Halomonas TaxID=2745 RepID=UPI001C999C75|nr:MULTISPECIES: ferrochelatase [Halomonas]MBY5968576.1 ferrochelatase [Halomonas denitrificans]MBY5984047.1 ferrochelatase [Halomonas sp. DP5Y7-2]
MDQSDSPSSEQVRRPPHAPADHPVIPRDKIGVLVANLGTPDDTGYWSMRRYLSEFLSDQRVVDYPRWLWQPLLQLVILSRRPFASGEAYRSIWNTEKDESPLLTITRNQADKLALRLRDAVGENIEVSFGMRYGNPSTEKALKELEDKGCRRILFFPLYPQYGSPTTATACDQFFRQLMKRKWQPAIRTASAYFDEPAYIDALAASVRERLAQETQPPTRIVASYHGVPKRFLTEGDPYYCQCVKTTRLLRERLGMPEEDVVTAFQSKFGPEEWVGPATVDKVAELARQGHKRIAVLSPAFSADCVETLEEIQQEIRDAFIEAGGETFVYIPCLNDRDDHIDALAGIVRRELAGWL